MTRAITKAIIPVAGWGSRMLPITKAIEKCMLPVGTRPVIDYIVQDVLAAGIHDIYFIVSKDKTQLQDFYSINQSLEDFLRRHGKDDWIPRARPPEGVTFHYILQPQNEQYGTSIPVGIAGDVVEDDESALVIMGDQFFWRTDGGSNAKDLIDLVRAKGVSAGLFGNPVPEALVSQFGIIEKAEDDSFMRIVEKPALEDAPSNLNNSSFYIFDKEIFNLAKSLPVNPARGEFEITDPINAYVASGKKIVVGEVKGQYMECGSVAGWLKANNEIVGSNT